MLQLHTITFEANLFIRKLLVFPNFQIVLKGVGFETTINYYVRGNS